MELRRLFLYWTGAHVNYLVDVRLVARFHLLAKVASVAVILVSCLVLVGWALDVETLKTVFPGMVAMNPGGTAVGFLLAGASLWLLLERISARAATRSGARDGGRDCWPSFDWPVTRLAGTTVRTAGCFAERSNNMKRPTAWLRTRPPASLLCGLALPLLDVRFRRRFARRSSLRSRRP